MRCSNRLTCHPNLTRFLYNKIADDIPTFKSLLVDLNRTANHDDGHSKALDILRTMEKLNYPIDSNIICKLFTISAKLNNKEMFTKVLGLVDKYVPYDVQVYTAVINGLLILFGFEEALKVYDEMISKGITPRKQLIYNMFGESVKQDDMENAAVFLDQIFVQYFPLPVSSAEEFIGMCLRHRRHDQVVKILEFYSTFNLPMENTLVDQLTHYFDGYRDR